MSWQRSLVGADQPFAPRVTSPRVTTRSGHGCVSGDAPTIGPRGQLMFRDHTAYLSERDALLAAVLVFNFEAEMSDAEILDRVWPDGATRRTLRHCLHRLDRRLARVGLEIVAVGDRAHALRPVDGN